MVECAALHILPAQPNTIVAEIQSQSGIQLCARLQQPAGSSGGQGFRIQGLGSQPRSKRTHLFEKAVHTSNIQFKRFTNHRGIVSFKSCFDRTLDGLP